MSLMFRGSRGRGTCSRNLAALAGALSSSGMSFRAPLSQTTNVVSTGAHSQGCVAGLWRAGEFLADKEAAFLDADITRLHRPLLIGPMGPAAVVLTHGIHHCRVVAGFRPGSSVTDSA